MGSLTNELLKLLPKPETQSDGIVSGLGDNDNISVTNMSGLKRYDIRSHGGAAVGSSVSVTNNMVNYAPGRSNQPELKRIEYIRIWN